MAIALMVALLLAKVAVALVVLIVKATVVLVALMVKAAVVLAALMAKVMVALVEDLTVKLRIALLTLLGEWLALRWVETRGSCAKGERVQCARYLRWDASIFLVVDDNSMPRFDSCTPRQAAIG